MSDRVSKTRRLQLASRMKSDLANSFVCGLVAAV